jgi:hypothetical protein
MDHHGWEFGLSCLVRIYEISVWPGCVLIAICLFRQEFRGGIKAIMAKLEHLIELKVTRTSASARFHKPPQETVTPDQLGIKD